MLPVDPAGLLVLVVIIAIVVGPKIHHRLRREPMANQDSRLFDLLHEHAMEEITRHPLYADIVTRQVLNQADRLVLPRLQQAIDDQTATVLTEGVPLTPIEHVAITTNAQPVDNPTLSWETITRLRDDMHQEANHRLEGEPVRRPTPNRDRVEQLELFVALMAERSPQTYADAMRSFRELATSQRRVHEMLPDHRRVFVRAFLEAGFTVEQMGHHPDDPAGAIGPQEAHWRREEHRRQAPRWERVGNVNRIDYGTPPPTPATTQDQDAAMERAKELLREHLNARQLAEFDANGWFTVVPPNPIARHSNGRPYRFPYYYRVCQRPSYNVDLQRGTPDLGTNGERVERICVVSATEWVPIFDKMLADKVLLETNEAEYRRIANIERMPF